MQCKLMYSSALSLRQKVPLPTSKQAFHFALDSPVTVSTRNRNSESKVQEILIDHAGKLYALRCNTRQWELVARKQP